MKSFLFLSVSGLFWAGLAYGQGLEQTIGQLNQVMNEVGGASAGSAGGGLFSGFSLWGVIGGLIFSGIGFVAFVYGKKNAEWPSMAIGIALMVYPCIIRGVFSVYAVGLSLIALWYFLLKI